jgi:hypothetical protein
MHRLHIARRLLRVAMGTVAAVFAAATMSHGSAVEAEKPASIKIAVFDFELVDSSAASVLLGQTTASAATMEKVSSQARAMLEQSGRYNIIDVSKVDAQPVKQKTLRDCHGCDAGIALQLGAQQSLIGVVTRVSMTDYYVSIQIRDARTGKLVDAQEANFAGSTEGWPTGVRMLIKHQILVDQS